MTACPLCGHENATGVMVCAACGHELTAADRPTVGRFFTPLPVLLMFGVPALATAVMGVTEWLYWRDPPIRLAEREYGVLILVVWAATALASGVGWPIAACRRWGFHFARLAVFFIVGLFAGITIFIAGWMLASEAARP